MYILGTSTPEKAGVFVSDRTHKNLIKSYGISHNGYTVWYHNGVKYRIVGTIVNNQLEKV